jgi:hypothetical protein
MPTIWFECTECEETSWISAPFDEEKPLTVEDLICDDCLEDE